MEHTKICIMRKISPYTVYKLYVKKYSIILLWKYTSCNASGLNAISPSPTMTAVTYLSGAHVWKPIIDLLSQTFVSSHFRKVTKHDTSISCQLFTD